MSQAKQVQIPFRYKYFLKDQISIHFGSSVNLYRMRTIDIPPKYVFKPRPTSLGCKPLGELWTTE